MVPKHSWRKTCPRYYLLCFVCFYLVTTAIVHANKKEWVYIVQPGDNLWDISARYLTRKDYWRKLQQLNRIDQPRAIPPGTTLRIPRGWLRTKSTLARVISVHGSVSGTDAENRAALDIRPGVELRAGDNINTGSDGNILIEFTDGSRVVIQRNSELVIERMDSVGDSEDHETQLHLKKGRIEVQVEPKKKPNSRFEIRTPAATSGVRGTEFRAGMDSVNEISQTEVATGAVDVNSEGKTVLVPADFGAYVKVGEPPADPKPLLAVPDLSDLPKVHDRLPLSVNWRPVEGAQKYRIHLFPSQQLVAKIVDILVAEPKLEVADIPSGDYVLRIRALDEFGIEGRNGEVQLTLDIPPGPPILIAPEQDLSVRSDRLMFQ